MWAELRLVLYIMLPLSAALIALAWAGCWWLEKAMYGDDSPLRQRELRD